MTYSFGPCIDLEITNYDNYYYVLVRSKSAAPLRILFSRGAAHISKYKCIICYPSLHPYKCMWDSKCNVIRIFQVLANMPGVCIGHIPHAIVDYTWFISFDPKYKQSGGDYCSRVDFTVLINSLCRGFYVIGMNLKVSKARVTLKQFFSWRLITISRE